MKKWIPLIIVVVVAGIIVIVSIFKCKGPVHNGDNDSITVKFNTHIYIENSGSMDGYVNGNTEFKDDIGHIMVMLNGVFGTPSISFVNSKIMDTGLSNNIDSFSMQLSPNAMHVGQTESSNINNIFKLILSKTDDKTVSVLISDCVYSIHGNNSRDLLSQEKNLTQNAFMTAIKDRKDDLATIVLQCTSKFNGYYYDMNDKPTQYSGNRPYYMIFVGKSNYIKEIYSKIELDKQHMSGLLNSYLVSSNKIDYNLDGASIITDDFTSENVKRIVPGRDSLYISSISLFDDKPYTMAVGFDASPIFVDESYLTDKNNYITEPKGIKIKAIGKVDQQSSAYGDCDGLNNPYYIQFECPSGTQDVSISLGYNIPKWVYSSSTDDDTAGVPSSNVTFGISYMIEGISEAYRVMNPLHNIFTIKFNIEKYN